MATPDPTADDRHVPLYVEDYIAQRATPVERELCSGCLEHQAVATDGANDYCRLCWTAMHAYDQAEEKMVRAILTAAIVAALSAGAGEDLVRHVVDDALTAPRWEDVPGF